ncbi:MAG: glycosyltransferase family 9 protein [Caulobacteraceae bacterium]|nr:glycosyltransferase family 9 protein [Caulobacteraceae bacterium]
MSVESASPGPQRLRAQVAVIVGQPGIGDMVWHQPALAAIARRHGGPVCLFARPSTQAAALFEASPDVAEVVAFDRGRGAGLLPALTDLTLKLRQGRFERCYVLSQRSSLALAAAMAGVPQRLGFGGGGQRGLLNCGQGLTDDETRAVSGGPVVECHQFLVRNGLPAPEAAPALAASSAARAAVRIRFAAAPRPWIALGVSANEDDRRWIPRRFAELARRLERRCGGTVFLYGGPHHAGQIDQVLERLPERAERIVDLSRQALPFDQVMALLAESNLFIGNDSGPLNLAAALGIPAYGLFGGAAPHASLSPRIRAILPAVGEPDLESGMERLTVDHVLDCVEPALPTGAAGLDARLGFSSSL